ncbi:MAG: ATP-binding protein [Deltaproteobacteria bacterium]|nr:ATP-binding protein [Deltaproteobacteria bacterium]
MIKRLINPLKQKSFFLFGARGVGKSTFLKEHFKNQRVLWFDLLDAELEDRFTLYPKEFYTQISGQLKKIEWVVIDEVQKCPKLLNYVQKLMVEDKIKFALTGSSARRLKQKGTNLLAGRALVESLYPFTFLELGDSFNLQQVLQTGSLPEVVTSSTPEEMNGFLRSYVLNYLKLEIQAEQWVRKLDPFRRFLPIAAQMNTKILNYTNIAQDVGVDTTTIQSYFDILEDTLLGVRLPAYARSIRKQQRKAPKFYFFDSGVKRAAERALDVPLTPGTYGFGEAFEHLVFVELFRLAQYFKKDYEFSYLLTKDGAEIDLIVDRPGKPLCLIEIKSKDRVDERDIKNLSHFQGDFKKADFFLLSNDPNTKRIASVQALPWREGILEILGIKSGPISRS